jgi:translation initiation factor 5A
LDVSDDGFLSLMDDTGATRDDLKTPDGELGAEIKAAIAEGRDILVSFLLHIISSLSTLVY